MTHLRAVLFDLDDTLTDRQLSIEKFAEYFRITNAAELPDCESSRIVRAIVDVDAGGKTPREELCSHLIKVLPWRQKPALSTLVAIWKTRFPTSTVERRGASAAISELRRRNVALGIVSNGTTSIQQAKLDALGFRSHFSTVLISESCGVKKPDARIFNQALRDLHVAASEAVFVGNNPEKDVLAAAGVGMKAIWVRGMESWPDGSPAWPVSIEHFGELLPILDAAPYMKT